MLGRKVSQVPANYEKGDLLVDTSMDLETNTTREFTRDNSLMLQRGKLTRDAQIKIAQTFRTGTNDIDALDYVSMFLDNEGQIDPQELNDRYVLVNFRPVVTSKNWRIDCGVAGYDNRLGLPPFFPTRLRFEDYIYRLWVQQAGLASAHVDAAQNHMKNNYMRNPLATEVFNEELCSLLKKKIKDSVYQRDDLFIKFHYQGEVTLQDSEEILTRIAGVHAQVLAAVKPPRVRNGGRRCNSSPTASRRRSTASSRTSFQQNVSRIVDDVVSQIQASLEIWPTLVEVCYYYKDKKPLPQIRVKNKRLEHRKLRLTAPRSHE